jgi:hypothetical protein
VTARKREIEKRLSKLERGRHCPACSPGEGGGDSLDAVAIPTGDWVAERLVIHREGEQEPSVAGCCPRCGREPHVVIVRERVVAVGPAALSSPGAPEGKAGNDEKPATSPTAKPKGRRRTR